MSPTTRHRARRRTAWRARTCLAAFVAGAGTVAGGAVGLTSAHAAGSPGSAFGNIDIHATATGIRVPGYSHQGEDVEGELPFASSQLLTGGSGHALTSAFWPGGTGGSGGSTVSLLAGSCLPGNPTNSVPLPLPPVPLPDLPCVAHVPTLPDNVYKAMNDSYKAEAQSSTGKPVQTKTGPGLTMRAVATASRITAASSIAGGKAPSAGESFGATSTTTSIKVTGPRTAVIDAVSVVRHLSLGNGAVKIAGVTSVAHAVTNGVTATGTAATTVTGMTIGGVPVHVDNSGIHIDGKGTALPSLAALNKALAKSGFRVFVANPVKKIQGPSAQLFAGQLVIMMTNSQYMSSANDTGTILTLGGATINATTSKGYVYHPGPLPSIPPPAAPVSQHNVPPPPANTGGTGTGTVPPAPQVATTPPPAAPPVLAASSTPLWGGIKPVWIVLVLLGSGLIAAGLKRLPDDVLAVRGAACALGEQS